MSMYKYIAEFWKQPDQEAIRKYMQEWRRQPPIIRIERPTNLTSARSRGYRAKKGFVLARVKVLRGGRQRPQMKSGRRSRTQRRRKIVNKSYQSVAEERANRRFRNCEVLNSYRIAQDGKNYWFEVILVDPQSPEIRRDRKINWILQKQHRGRSFRGLTSSARKSRGLRKKGKGTEKTRPSLRARGRTGH